MGSPGPAIVAGQHPCRRVIATGLPWRLVATVAHRHETLDRAIEFVERRAGLDTEVADIAEMAGVTVRAIQLAFRQHLDTTPTAYMRAIRLEHAHRQLVDSTPGDGITVTRTAVDWGFANPSRFAAYYRAAYGRPPGQTLRG
jgi:transcriptional regulator GlxA family with amidase domain